MKIYAITSSANKDSIRLAELFLNFEDAKARFKIIKDARRYNFGVQVDKDTDTVFHITMGWEEISTYWNIIELDVN